jgi:hypothetical protein
MRMPVRRLALAALVALAAGAAPVAAQQLPLAPVNASPAVAGPTLENARAAARPLASAQANALSAAAAPQSVGRPAALMLVGFGALLAGAIIGDDVGTIFMVGGAIIGLYGLYEYLK